MTMRWCDMVFAPCSNQRGISRSWAKSGQAVRLKGVGLAELAEAVRKAARGEAVLHPQVAARLVQELRAGSKENASLFITLSEREREVLRLIADGLKNAEIASRLFISERTVKSHINNILSKLHVADRTQAAIYAWREGFMGK